MFLIIYIRKKGKLYNSWQSIPISWRFWKMQQEITVWVACVNWYLHCEFNSLTEEHAEETLFPDRGVDWPLLKSALLNQLQHLRMQKLWILKVKRKKAVKFWKQYIKSLKTVMICRSLWHYYRAHIRCFQSGGNQNHADSHRQFSVLRSYF